VTPSGKPPCPRASPQPLAAEVRPPASRGIWGIRGAPTPDPAPDGTRRDPVKCRGRRHRVHRGQRRGRRAAGSA